MEQNNTIHKFRIKKCTPLKRLFEEYHQITVSINRLNKDLYKTFYL